MLDSEALIRELIAVPGPPGGEEPVREVVARHAAALGFDSRVDAKGNLIVALSGEGDVDDGPMIVVTAHLDELGLLVQRVELDGRLKVAPLGGIHPWKWGEIPVSILSKPEPLPGVLSFGSIHTTSPASVVQHARTDALLWEMARIFTGRHPFELDEAGVRPGTRIVIEPAHRTVTELGPFVCSYFLDDRADLVAWLLALELVKEQPVTGNIVFAATTCEEVGGEGAQYLFRQIQPEVCIALEIGPSVPESPFMPDPQPTIWVTDTYSSTAAADLDLLAEVCEETRQRPHWQALSRGGSDASCAAAAGLVARPITLGLPVENSHGYEIMHREAPKELAKLTVALLRRLTRSGASEKQESAADDVEHASNAGTPNA